MEKKAIDFKFEDGKLIINVDLNKDGESVLKLEVDLTELPQEIWDAWRNK